LESKRPPSFWALLVAMIVDVETVGENFSEMQWLEQEIKNAATEEDA
jgi:hypothetical protein